MNGSLSRRCFALLLPLLLVTGCGSDRPVLEPPADQPHPAEADRPPAALADSTPADSASGEPSDPLVGDAGQSKEDPLARHDPLLGQDPMEGRGMPTEHSHWLNAEMQEAHVMVQLNGLRLGAFVQPGTQEVTKMLRPGTNMLTVTYEPQNENSWGSVTLSEGEHNAHAVVLAAFRRAPLSKSSVSDAERSLGLKPVTQTFVFSAQ